MSYYQAVRHEDGHRIVTEDGDTIVPWPDMTREQAETFALNMNVALGVGLAKGKLVNPNSATIRESHEAYMASHM